MLSGLYKRKRPTNPCGARPNGPNDELEALKAEARMRAWKALQELTMAGGHTISATVEVCEQVPAGSVTASADRPMETDAQSIQTIADWGDDGVSWAWAHPFTGMRQTDTKWPSHLQDLLAADPQGFVTEVVIYASRVAFTVRYDEPKPATPPTPPAAVQPAAELSDLEALKIEVSNFIDIETGNPAPKATALALLDIAQSMRGFLNMLKGKPWFADMDGEPGYRNLGDSLPSAYPPEPPPMVCTCTGDGLFSDGSPCVCPEGTARKRAAEVKKRAENASYS